MTPLLLLTLPVDFRFWARRPCGAPGPFCGPPGRLRPSFLFLRSSTWSAVGCVWYCLRSPMNMKLRVAHVLQTYSSYRREPFALVPPSTIPCSFCCCCCFRRKLTEQDVYVDKSLRTNWQEPSSTHRCGCSRARKLALNSGTTGGARKKGVNTAEKAPPTPINPFIAAITAKSSTRLCCTTGMSTVTSDN